MDELGIGSSGGLPNAYKGALLSDEMGVVGCWRGDAAAPVGNGQHVGHRKVANAMAERLRDQMRAVEQVME